MRARRLLPLLVTAVLVGFAAPASADPAGPTHYRSTVTEVTPATDAIDVEVLGGDAYVALRATPGTAVEIAGYDDEPYVRILEDGTVERNEASPARWLNEARFGALDTSVPPEASAEAPPRWETVASGGEYAWHDHRVHWMSPADPRQVDTGRDEVQPVQTWELELTVDGEPVVAAGELVWIPGGTPVLPVGLALLVLAAGVLAVVRGGVAARWMAVAGAVPAAVVGVAATVGWPAGADSDPALLILPGMAVLLAGVSYLIRARPGIGPALLGAASGFPLLVWGVLWSRALVAPIVPTVLPDTVARALVGVVLGVGLTALVAVAHRLLQPSADHDQA